MSAYYNEIDPSAAAWLRELIKCGHIADGEVDERSIEDVLPSDVAGFTQCHFFAGIGGWSYALRLAGWPDDKPVWTGSCPCQPFSAAGKGAGTADERHLWPAFDWIISQCRPPTVFGEQVASRAGRDWFAVVRSDLEKLGYAVGAADLCAAGIGAPHIRQRLYFVADASGERPDRQQVRLQPGQSRQASIEAARSCDFGGLVNPISPRLEGFAGHGRNWNEPGRINANPAGSVAEAGGLGVLADTDGGNASTEWQQRGGQFRQQPQDGGAGEYPETLWARADWIPCRDGKARCVEPGTFPLAHGVPARLGRLRGYGNAIVPQVAAAFVRAAA